MPALKDFIHIGPLQSPGVEAGLLIGHLKGLGIEIHIQPGLGIPVLRRGQAPPGDLQQLHQVGRPGIPGILGLHIGRRLFQGVDALLRPGVGLLLNDPQRGVPVGALPAQPLLAIAHQHAHHLGGQVQVIPEGQEDFQLLGGENPPQGPLYLPHQEAEFFTAVHSLGHVLLGVLGRLLGGAEIDALLRPEAQLPEGSGGAGIPGLAHPQGCLRLPGRVAALEVQVQQGRIPAPGGKQLVNFSLRQGQVLGVHGNPPQVKNRSFRQRE